MTTIIFKCDVCGSEYNSLEKATECEKQPLPISRFVVGDVVYIRTVYEGVIRDEVVRIVVEDHDIIYVTKAKYGWDDRHEDRSYKWSRDYIGELLLESSVGWYTDGGVMMTKEEPKGKEIKDAIPNQSYDTYT